MLPLAEPEAGSWYLIKDEDLGATVLTATDALTGWLEAHTCLALPVKSKEVLAIRIIQSGGAHL